MTPPVGHLVLDRDGVLNHPAAGGWLSDVADWRWEVGAEDALARIARHGVVVSIVTNQSCVGRGTVPAAAVEAIHAWLDKVGARPGVQRGMAVPKS